MQQAQAVLSSGARLLQRPMPGWVHRQRSHALSASQLRKRPGSPSASGVPSKYTAGGGASASRIPARGEAGPSQLQQQQAAAANAAGVPVDSSWESLGDMFRSFPMGDEAARLQLDPLLGWELSRFEKWLFSSARHLGFTYEYAAKFAVPDKLQRAIKAALAEARNALAAEPDGLVRPDFTAAWTDLLSSSRVPRISGMLQQLLHLSLDDTDRVEVQLGWLHILVACGCNMRMADDALPYQGAAPQAPPNPVLHLTPHGAGPMTLDYASHPGNGQGGHA